MFEDRGMTKYVWALLGFASIICPGPLVPMLCTIFIIAFMVYKIKRAKESPEGFEELMLDFVIIAIILVVNIGFFLVRIAVYVDTYKDNYSSSEKYTLDDLAEVAIFTYKLENEKLFSSKRNNVEKIQTGFEEYLKEELELNSEDLILLDNTITIKVKKKKIVFTIIQNDISYEIKKK